MEKIIEAHAILRIKKVLFKQIKMIILYEDIQSGGIIQLHYYLSFKIIPYTMKTSSVISICCVLGKCIKLRSIHLFSLLF